MKITKQNLEVYVYIDKEWSIRWYKNDERHREDGPVEIWDDGREFYYLNDEGYDEEYYWREIHANY